MRGKHNSVLTRMKQKVPTLFDIHCLSHSVHLAASNASKIIPKDIDYLMSKIYAWFSFSPKEEGIFHRLQDEMGYTQHKILRKADTRWLSVKQAIDRILEQWEPLEQYFSGKTDNKTG